MLSQPTNSPVRCGAEEQQQEAKSSAELGHHGAPGTENLPLFCGKDVAPAKVRGIPSGARRAGWERVMTVEFAGQQRACAKNSREIKVESCI
jgi:hypothetical protein